MSWKLPLDNNKILIYFAIYLKIYGISYIMNYFRIRAKLVLLFAMALFVVQLAFMPCCWQKPAQESSNIQHHHGIIADNTETQANHHDHNNFESCPLLQILALGFIVYAMATILLYVQEYSKIRFAPKKIRRSWQLEYNFFSITPLAPPLL